MTEHKKVVYLGDDSLLGAAAYLGGVLTHAGIDFNYVPSAEEPPAKILERHEGLIILSDYPAANLVAGAQEAIVKSVSNGASLLMVGGWESFHGLAGEYNNGPVGKILPLTCLNKDDRINCFQGAMPKLEQEHPCLANLPWQERPPVFCGFNETKLAPGATLLLSARLLETKADQIYFAEKEYPLLALASHGSGKTAALTTDLAPHWVGGWVDWGRGRIKARAPGGAEVEVGDWYVSFITQLVEFLLA